MKRAVPVFAALLAITGSLEAFTNDTLIEVVRHCAAETVSAGDSVQVFFAIVNDQSSDLSGLFFSDQIPAPFRLVSSEVRVDGSTLPIGCRRGYCGEVYEGTTPHRWILEEPSDFGEGTSIPSGGAAEIEYVMECHGSGIYVFENYSWVGGLVQESDTEWVFGYDTGSFSLFVEGDGGSVPFIRGDANTSGGVTVADAVHVLKGLYVPEGHFLSCLDAGDSDDDGELTMEDAIHILKFSAIPGVDIPSPSPDCGLDPTPDYLDCLAYPPCNPVQ